MALPRKYRIVRDKDFDRAFRSGKVGNSRQVSLRIIPNSVGNLRFGVAVSGKRFPHAVTRNRVKRRIFSEAAELIKEFKIGYDVIVVALTDDKEDRGVIGEFIRQALNKIQAN